MTNPDESDTKYLKELKKHYVYDVVNYMFRESDNKFSRPYSLLSLATLLHDDNDKQKYYGLREIAKKAMDLGFEGAENLIGYGLNSAYEAGLVEIEKINEKSYRLNPRFSQWVIKQRQGINTTIKNYQTKTSFKQD